CGSGSPSSTVSIRSTDAPPAGKPGTGLASGAQPRPGGPLSSNGTPVTGPRCARATLPPAPPAPTGPGHARAPGPIPPPRRAPRPTAAATVTTPASRATVAVNSHAPSHGTPPTPRHTARPDPCTALHTAAGPCTNARPSPRAPSTTNALNPTGDENTSTTPPP